MSSLNYVYQRAPLTWPLRTNHKPTRTLPRCHKTSYETLNISFAFIYWNSYFDFVALLHGTAPTSSWQWHRTHTGVAFCQHQSYAQSTKE